MWLVYKLQTIVHGPWTIFYDLLRQLQREHEEIIFPDAFVYPVSKVAVEGHSNQS